jgi:hypothetical protein
LLPPPGIGQVPVDLREKLIGTIEERGFLVLTKQ